ncbi:MAG: hypothetical protein CMM10_16070 [Rhodospirillaceae bacterium]|nr:hypothetical protein [Rhodospirillaceae bacterium]
MNLAEPDFTIELIGIANDAERYLRQHRIPFLFIQGWVVLDEDIFSESLIANVITVGFELDSGGGFTQQIVKLGGHRDIDEVEV